MGSFFAIRTMRTTAQEVRLLVDVVVVVVVLVPQQFIDSMNE